MRVVDTGTGCPGISILGVTQDPADHGSGQPALVDPALSRGGWTRWSPEVPSELNNYLVYSR